ncbi:MAG: AbrB/MazE/SpoVT family DNA-binding domain-containing protein, partial [Tissierellales bacterium]|nr:AbrB/MazE/SpoVT family DNA-binding domain-containing protein [Tissierellales bacterium]
MLKVRNPAMYSAKITSKGQITVPKKVRDRLGVSEGDAVYFVEVDGEFRMKKASFIS